MNLSGVIRRSDIPVDIAGVEMIGVDSWQESFWWPVEHSAFQGYWDKITSTLFTAINSSASPYRNILIASWKASYEYAQYVFLLLAERMAAKHGRRLLIHDLTRYSQLVRIERCIEYSHPNVFPYPEPRSHRARQSARIFRDNMNQPLQSAALLAGLRSPKYLSLGRPKGLRQLFCAQNGIKPLCIPIEYLSSPAGRHEADSTWIEAGQELAMQYARLTQDLCGPLGREQLDFLSRFLTGALNEYFSCYYSSLDRLDRIVKAAGATLLASSLGHPFCRTIVQAFRAMGGRVIGFSHGNLFAYPLRGTRLFNDYAVSDTYVVTSDSEARNVKTSLEHITPSLPELSAQIVVTNDYSGRNAAKRQHRRTVPPNEIMLAGSALNTPQHPEWPELMGVKLLHMELFFAKEMAKRGFSVTYKAHPSVGESASRIFAGRVKTIITDRFENVADTAHCIAHLTFASTTFGAALSMDIPHIFMNGVDLHWMPDVLSAVKNRSFFMTPVVHSDNSVLPATDDLDRISGQLRDPEQLENKMEAGMRLIRELQR